MAFVERRARDFRARHKLDDQPGYLALLDADPGVEIEEAPAERGCFVIWSDGTATIWGQAGPGWIRSVFHERGHLDLGHGLGVYLRQCGCSWFRRVLLHEECAASRWMREVLIPERLARSELPDWVVAEDCRVTEEDVRRRRQDLAHRR